MRGPAAAVILAAGAGVRMGAGVNKAFLPLAGAPILAWSVRALAGRPDVGLLGVVGAPGELKRCQEVAGEAAPGRPLRVVPGGRSRQESELRGLEAIEPDIRGGDVSMVLVHDAARPFAAPGEVDRLLAAARRTGAAILAVQAAALGTAGPGGRLETLERGLWLAQTPQAFAAAALLDAERGASAAGFEATDTAAVAEWAGLPVEVVPGTPRNLKITSPEDLAVASRMAAYLARGEAAVPGELVPLPI